MSEKLYKIMKNEKIGRYLIADQDLKKGSRVFTDVPFVIGPKPDSPPVCLGCYRIWNGSYRCTVCGWPCCSLDCEQISEHRNYECNVFMESNAQFQDVKNVQQSCLQFDCITPLRVLLETLKNTDRWKNEVEQMEDHNAERKLLDTWEMDQINIVQYLHCRCKLGKIFSEEMIQKVCGILEVNAVEVPLHNRPNIRAIYPKVGIMSHNCVPNIVHTISSENNYKHLAEIWAATDIKKGEKLEMCYTDVLLSTIQRRDHLKQSKFFDCDCKRCADPTELGTYLSTLKCNQCDNGTVQALDPLNTSSIWKCSKCKFSIHSYTVRQLLSVVQNEIAFTENTIGQSQIDVKEDAATWYEGILHNKHSLLVILKYDLAQLYGKTGNYEMGKLSVAHLNRKASMCIEVLQVLDIIFPGQNRMRGIMLFELHHAMMKLAQIEHKTGKINNKQLKEKISQIAKMLLESGEILSKEDQNSEKGMIGRTAMSLYENIFKLYDLCI